MNSREKILTAVKNSQPLPVDLPELSAHVQVHEMHGPVGSMLDNGDSILTILREKFAEAERIISTCPEFSETVPGRARKMV